MFRHELLSIGAALSLVGLCTAAEPAATSILLRHALDVVPEAPWLRPHGAWEAKDGAVFGTETPAEHHGGSLKGFATFTDADFTYEVLFTSLDAKARHTLGINSSPPGHLFHIDFTPTRMQAVKNDLDKDGPEKPQVLEQAALRLKANVWYPLRVRIRGDEVTAELDGVTLRAKHPYVGRAKGSFNLYVAGPEAIGFRRFQLTAADNASPPKDAE